MSDASKVKVRRSLHDLQKDYEKGNKKPLEDLVRAWAGIKALPPSDKRSFFVLGGYHGEPFQYRTQVDSLSPTDQYTYWGGYCNHGNVLFPVWHRVYVLKVEQALQTIVPDVAMAFWDETNKESLDGGIPWILTNEKFELDGKTIDNPLRSFTLPLPLSDYMPGDDRDYVKPQGYETVRYPLSGLVGTEKARVATAEHNAQYPHPSENVALLNANVKAWLHGNNPTPKDPEPSQDGIYWQYENCLKAPNYTIFSNTTSAGQWNLDHPGVAVAVPLEQPHNDIHLSVGGFDLPGPQGGESGQISGANGDMGENNTAAMDPIFFFHHCNVDRMFWLWQKQHDANHKLDVMQGYYGTNSSDSQGPTPGVAPGTPLDLTTPLNPFVKDEFGTVYTGNDCVDTAAMGYTYGKGSLEDPPRQVTVKSGYSHKKLTVRGIDRALFQGSFIVNAYATVDNGRGEETEYYLGHQSVFSRRNVVKCANCLTHLEVIANFPLSAIPEGDIAKAKFSVQIQHRGTALPAKLKYEFSVS
jgi:tyrosinase